MHKMLNLNTLILFTILITYSCGTSNIDSKESLIETKTIKDNSEIKSYDTIINYSFNINNLALNDFGYTDNEAYPSITVSQVLLDSSFIYFLDSYHGNIKRLETSTGKLIASKKLDTINGFLSCFAFFKNKIYVFDEKGTLYLLNNKMQIESTYLIPDFKDTKYIYNQSTDSLALYRKDDVSQFDKREMTITSRVFFNSKENVIKPYIFESYEKYDLKVKHNLRGMFYDIKETKDGFLLENQFGKFKIKENIPKPNFFFDGVNFDFNKNTFVYFIIDNDKFVVKIYKYKN